jgi:hypothetical protein
MDTAQTISKKKQSLPSMRYDELRLKGLELAQLLAGNIWTDYNVHDPGVNILEVLSYAITELGYRSDFNIMDILTEDPKNPSFVDLKNFYTACKILPNCPVTFNDYRKLIIDTEIVDLSDPLCEHAGVRNAWISKSSNQPAEQRIYVNRKDKELSLDPIPGLPQQECYFVKTLYDVLLELDSCERFGDLDSNAVEGSFTIDNFPLDINWEGSKIYIEVFFPRWDDDSIDWDDLANIREGVTKVKLEFKNIPDNYKLTHNLQSDNTITIDGVKDEAGSPDPLLGMTELANLINGFIYHPVNGLIGLYTAKMTKVHEIISEVRTRLHDNRNLCEDFYKIKAVRVEDILLCADIELAANTDVETTAAEIYYRIGNFLSPEVKFRTLEEMQELCKAFPRFAIEESSNTYQWVAIEKPLAVDINKDDVISILQDEEVIGTYTVQCVQKSEDYPNLTEIEFSEELDLIEDTEYVLMAGEIEEGSCLTVDEIYQGPKLKHGFIDDDELEAADLRSHIHVSDLIRIIMDIEGVLAVKSIQIANRPQDDDPAASSKSVKWCLELNVDKCYVPQLHIDDSRLIFYKEQLPFIAKSEEVNSLLDEKKLGRRPQKIYYPELDIPAPTGTYNQLDDYTSIQEEFPQVYGVGSDGIPEIFEPKTNVTEYIAQKNERIAQVMQLKGYLMPFDQMLANFLSQLHHVKYLFSMNGEMDAFDNYLIDRTYFVKSLVDVIPNGVDLYKDPVGHLTQLKALTEDEDLYVQRRNKFLDHLLARFSENFADYALLAYSVDGVKAPLELIEDKLQFLNRYPELSSGRGKAFNYKSPCELWHIDNVSGLELRSSLLLGIEQPTADNMAFSARFRIFTSGNQFGYQVLNAINTPVLESSKLYETAYEAKLALETAIINGAIGDRFMIVENESGTGSKVILQCDELTIAQSSVTNLSVAVAASLIENLQDLFLSEFLHNPLSNRKNLACPINQYIVLGLPSADMSIDPDIYHAYQVDYEIYSKPLTLTPENLIFSGTMRIPVIGAETEAEVLDYANDNLETDFWILLWNAKTEDNFIFEPVEPIVGDTYRFALCDRYGVITGRSQDSNFNDVIAAEIDDVRPKNVVIIGEDGSLENLRWDTVSSLGSKVFVRLNRVPATPSPRTFKFTRTINVSSIDFDTHIIEINSLLAKYLIPGDVISLVRTGGDADPLTIFNISESGGKTIIIYKENLPAIPGSLKIQYNKEFPISTSSGRNIVLIGGADQKALTDFTKFIKTSFFSKEGMHLLEHVLIRPKTHEMALAPIIDELDVSLVNNGSIIFEVETDILEVNIENEQIRLAGDLTADIQVGDKIRISEFSANGGKYTVSGVSFIGGNTVIETEENLIFTEPDADFPNSSLYYRIAGTIDSVDNLPARITTSRTEAADILAKTEIIIQGSSGGNNDGKYTASGTFVGGNVEVTLLTKEQFVSDPLLPIKLDNDCESCRLTDPYSCIATIVLPYWTGRFTNLDLRKFVEKTLREEAPAHTLLNICWINCEQMTSFEIAFKKWLIATNRIMTDKAEISARLQELIDIIRELRTVYPQGTLHSCDDDDVSGNAIILSKSALGTL